MQNANKNNNFHYNPKLKDYANTNRKSMTKSEACTWKYLLKARMMKGYQFRRQRPILNYIADFVCLELMLVIEIDGITHDDEDRIKEDEIRTKELENIGFRVIRFSAWEILNKIDDVAIIIGDWIDDNETCPPPKPRQRGKHKEQ